MLPYLAFCIIVQHDIQGTTHNLVIRLVADLIHVVVVPARLLLAIFDKVSANLGLSGR